MASDFLNKMASDRAAKIDKEYGAGSYGSSAWLEKPAAPSKSPSSGTGKKKKNKILEWLDNHMAGDAAGDFGWDMGEQTRDFNAALAEMNTPDPIKPLSITARASSDYSSQTRGQLRNSDTIAQEAFSYFQAHPDVKVDSRTIDGWLHDNDYSGDAAKEFKAYLKKYGAGYSPLADKDTRANTFNTDDRQNKIAENVMYKNFNQEAADALLKDVDALTEAISKSFNTDRYQTADERAATAHNIDSLQECLRRLTAMGYDTSEMLGEMDSLYDDNSKLDEFYRQFTGAEQFAEWTDAQNGKVHNVGKLFVGAAHQGLEGWANRAYNLLDMVAGGNEGWAQEVWYMLGMDAITGMDDNIIHHMKNVSDAEAQSVAEHYATNASATKLSRAINEYGTAAFSFVPDLITMLLTAGTSAAATGTAGVSTVARTGGLAAYSDIATAGNRMTEASAILKSAAQDMAHSPAAITSFVQITGDSYKEALDNGSSRGEAEAYALMNGFLGTLIEVGGADEALGGIQKHLPEAVRETVANPKVSGILKTFGQSLSEGKEEVEQGVLGRLLYSEITGTPVELFSTENEDALINPNVMVKDALGGIIVGGVMTAGSLGTAAAVHAVDTKIKTAQIGDALKGRVFGTMQSLVVGTTYNKESETYKKAQSIYSKLEAADNVADAYKKIKAKDIVELRQLMETEREEYGPTAQTEADAAALTQAIHPEATVLSGTAGSLVEAGLSVEQAQKSAEVIEALARGESVSSNQINKVFLRPDSGAARAAFTEATGIEVPTGTSSELRAFFKSVPERIKANAQSAQQIVDQAREQQSQVEEPAAEAAPTAVAPTAVAPESPAVAMPIPPAAQAAQPTAEVPAAETTTPAATPIPTAAQAAAAKVKPRKKARTPAAKTRTAEVTQRTVELKNGERLDRDRFHTMMRNAIREVEGETEVTEDELDQMFEEALKLNAEAGPLDAELIELGENGGSKLSLGMLETLRDRTAVGPEAELIKLQQHIFTETERMITRFVTDTVTKYGGVKHVVIDNTLEEEANGMIQGETMYLNPGIITNESALQMVIGHEYFHRSLAGKPTDKARHNAIDEVIDTYKDMAQRGMLSAKLERQVKGLDAKVEETRQLYHEFLINKENPSTGKQYTEDELTKMLDDYYIKEEIACDWMGIAFESSNTLARMAGVKPSVATRLVRTIRDLVDSVFGDELTKDEIELERTMKALSDELLRGLEAAAKGEAETTGPRYAIPAKGQVPTQMGPTEADVADASVITDPEGPVTTAVRDVHDAVKKFSLSSLAQASGFVAKQDEETGEVWFERNGERVDTVTVEDIDNSPIGALIDYSRDIGDFGTNRKAARQMADEQKQFFADFCTMAATTRDFQFAGSALFTALKSNSDAQYRTTYDFPSICTKTQAVIDVMSKAMVEKAKANAEKGTYEGGLTPEEIEYCYYQVHFDGNPVPCPECYVFSRWVGIGGLLDNIWNYQNVYAEMSVDAVEAEYQAMLSEMDAYAKANDINLGRAKGSLAKKYSKKYEDLKEKIEKADNQGEKVKDTDRQALRLMELKMNTVKAMTWIDKVYFGGKAHTKASPRRFVPADVLFNLNDGNTFATDYPEAWGFRCTQGAGYGKAIAPYAEAVVGEGILGTANTNATLKSKKDGTLANPFIDSSKIDLNDKNKAGRTKKLESARKKQLTQAFIGGQRFSSTSDARFENATDFLIAALEVQAMHGMVQVYTKVPGAVPVYDKWGFSSNMSLMPKGSGLDSQGRPVDTSVGGMNPQVARELRDEYEYQGTITIGLNDNHIRKLFNQTWRDFIIPYHASGGKAELVASFRSIQDNGDVNNVHSTDYTRVQGEKVLSNEVLRWQGKSDKEIDQIHANREARLAILTGKGAVDMSVVNKNPYLKELYSRLHGKWKGVQLTRGVCEKQIFPNEYWDESVSYEDSKKITTDYLAYCESLGMLHKFSGMVPSNGKLITIKGYDENGARVPLTDLAYKYDKEGNKTEEVEDYFWKVLTDRRMFGNQGQYLPQRFVNLTGTTTAEMMDFGTTNRFGERAGRQYDPTKAAQTAEVVAQNIVNGTVPELKNSPLRAAAEKKAKKDDKKYSLSDFKPKANTEGMTAISEAIMHIEEIKRFTGKEFVDIYKKYPAVNFIERFIAGDPTVVRDLKMSIEGADYIALDKLKYYPVHALPSSFRKAHRGAITKYNKVFNEAIENAIHADKPIVGRDLGIKSGEVSLTRLEELFNELNSNDEIEELARKVFNFVRENPEIARNIKFKRIGSDPFDRRTMGLQFGDKVRYDTTFFNSPYLTDQKKAGTILHELIHASTVYALEGYNLGWYMDNPPLEDACKAIYDVYREIQHAPEMVNADGKRFYGCTNAKEMVAELANPEFRLALKKKNLWERLVDAIKRLLGIEPGNAYDAVNRAFDRLLENYDYGLERRYIRAAMNSGSRYNNFSEVEAETTAAEEEIFDAGTRYSLRTEAPPKKTQWGFKLMTVDADGKPHAMFIDSEMPYEIGEWYNADSPNLDDLKDLEPGFTYLIGEDGKIVEDGLDFTDGRGRPQHIEGRYPILHDGKPKLPPKGAVKAATGIGARWMRIDMYSANQQHMSPTNDGKRYSNVGIGGGGSVSTFAIRPGIHAVDIPSMAHIGAENEQGEIDRRRPDQRWFLIEYPVDRDYNQEAFGNRTKDIRNHLPTDGWYSFQTNSGAEKRQHWFITGAMKIVGAVSEKDVRAYTESKGFEQDLEWKDGKVYDDAADTIDLMKYAEEHQDTRTPSKAEMREKIEAGRKGDKKYSLGDGYVESGNSARMTNDRIDYLIDDSGAGRKKDYAQMWITSINPTDFINLTTGKIQDRELFDKYPGDYGTTVDEYDFIDGLKKNMRQTPYLNIDAYGNVIGHEGRHRMRALERKGITSAEIVVRFYDEGSLIKNVNVVNGRLETLDTAIVTNQMGTGQTATLTNLIPVNLDHKEEILQSYGEGHAAEGDIRYSLRNTPIPTYDELIKKPPMPIVDIRGNGEGSYKEQRIRIRETAESSGILAAPIVNKDTGESIFITDNTYKHMYSNKENAGSNINASREIVQLLENAVLTHGEPEKNQNRTHVTGVYTFFAAARNEVGTVPIVLTIKEYRLEGQDLPKNIKEYFDKNGPDAEYASVYDGKVLVLEEIEKEASSSALSDSQDNPRVDKYPSASEISIEDLMGLVNSEYQKYLPKKETSKSDLDSDYLELAKDPEANREQLQAMVDEAAKRAGYDSPRLYHGTHSFGFTKFDLDMMDDKSTIFLTDNEYVAESYGGTLDKKDVSGRPFDPMTASDEEVLRRYNELNSHRQAAKIYTPDEVADLRAEYLSEIRKSSEAVQKLYQAMQNVEFRDALGLTDSDLQTVYALNTAAKSIATDGAADDLLYVDGLISSIMRTMSTNLSRSYGIMVPSEGFANSIRMLAVLNGITTNNEKVVITEKHGFAQTMKQVRRQLADNLIAEADQGIYSLYVNTDNLFEIECNGDLWDEIDVPKELREYVPVGANELVNTRRIAAAAKEAGYDGVIFRDIVDVGADAYDYYESDVYAIYDPGRAKSADPVTYDDNGNVIPLSERFSPENDDIRYSLKPGEKPTAETKRTVLTGSSVGTILSRVRGNTFAYSKFFNETELMMQGLREEDMTYNPMSEAESMRQAESRLRADYAGEKKNLGAAGKAWSGADLDTAMGILSNELAKARATDSEKSYDEVVRWAQMIRLKGTQAGQMIQAFAKYTRTPEGVLVRAVDDLDKTNLDKDQKKELLNKVRDFANTLSAIKDGDKAGLIEIILRQAKQRNTKVSSATRKALEKQEFTYLYNTAVTQLDQITKDYISASAGKKIATYQTISHLLNLRTAGRNVISNTVFNFIDTVANNIAVVPDLMMSIITGKRTVGLESSLTKSAREGAKAGRAKAQIEIALDVAPDDSRDKYGTARRTWKMVGNPGAKVMSSLEKAMGFELNYTDESAKGRIRGMVMQSLKPFVEKGWMTVEEAESLAEQEALYRTFQDDTLLSRFMGDMKKAFNVFGFGGQRSTEYEDQIARGNKVKRAIDKNTHDFGLGDIVLKYTQVPGALLTRAFEYSPVGAAKALRNIGLFVSSKHALNQQAKAAQQTIEKYREAAEAGDAVAQEMIRRAEAKLRKAEIKLTRDQRMAALQMSRAFTGTGLITLFAMAALKGVMSRADDEGDADAKSLLNSQGISGTQLNLDALVRMMNGESTEWREGDVLAAVDFLEPLNSLMTMGAMVAKSDECQSVWDMYKNPDLLFNRGAANALYYSIGELSVMQTLQTIQNSAQYYDPDSGIPQWLTIAIDVARGSATGFIPGPVRQLGQAMDPYYRDSYSSKDIGDRFRDSIWGALPGARETLPIKQTPLGEDKMQEEQPLRAINAFLMPGSLRTYRETAMTKELERVYEASGATNIFPDRNAPYKVNVPGSEYELDTAARRQYQLTRGNEYTQAVGAMMNSDAYKSADAVTQGELLAKAKSFANYLAKKEVDGANGGSYTDAEMENYIAARDATGMSIADYYQARGPLSDIKSDKKPDGKTIRDSRKPKVIDYINGLDYLTPEQKTYIFVQEYSSYLNDDGSYKNTIYELPWN